MRRITENYLNLQTIGQYEFLLGILIYFDQRTSFYHENKNEMDEKSEQTGLSFKFENLDMHREPAFKV